MSPELEAELHRAQELRDAALTLAGVDEERIATQPPLALEIALAAYRPPESRGRCAHVNASASPAYMALGSNGLILPPGLPPRTFRLCASTPTSTFAT